MNRPANQHPADPADRPESFPRRSARTQRFTLGAPRTFTVATGHDRVLFLRSAGGTDPRNRLWAFDADSGEEVVLADPTVLGQTEAGLSEAEIRRRERAREGSGGITTYAVDERGRRAAFVHGGALYGVSIDAGSATASSAVSRLEASGSPFDPRPAPVGDAVAYVAGAELRLVDPYGDRLVAGGAGEQVSWGSAEFIAAEEMGRSRGHWWAPDGAALAVARVDVGPVDRWHIGDPARPERAPAVLRYPAAGRPNAAVSLHLLSMVGDARQLRWDAERYPYLAAVNWASPRGMLVTLQPRDQRTLVVARVDVARAELVELLSHHDERWVELVPGAPCWWGEEVVVVVDVGGARRVVVDGEPITHDALQVRSVAGTLADDLVITASEDDPTQTHVYRLRRDGELEALTHEPGVHAATSSGELTVVTSTSLDRPGGRTRVLRDGKEIGEVRNLAADPGLSPRPRLARLGARRLATAVLTPGAGADADAGEPPWPVLLDPYGGPHAQRAVRAHNAYLVPQWFADHGFAVVVADGRGTPGRGPQWEREVWGDLAQPVLDDQIDALTAAAADDDRLDSNRVAIRGWSFGGYLAALAVLRRPDVFHAAVAGAPVTDWRLYDTHYTERYLGHPDRYPEHYERCDLVGEAASLTRPLLLIHGLADDNVVAAHTLRLSAALLAAGRRHEVLPLSGVTHMTPQEVVAENLLLLQLDFLRRALGLATPPALSESGGRW